MKAIYVSIWDGCSIESQCDINPETNEVWDIEIVDTDDMDLEVLEDEYILLPNGDKIHDFINLDQPEGESLLNEEIQLLKTYFKNNGKT